MPELPRHPDTSDAGHASKESATGKKPWRGIVIAVFFGALLIAMNFLVDVAYGLIDPRIRHAQPASK